MKLRWLVRCIPFVLVCIIHLCAWVQLLSGANEPVLRHYLALALILLNLFLYFKKPDNALLLTGVILLLSSFTLIELYTYVNRSYYTIGFGNLEVTTPGLQGNSVMLLVLYLLLNCDYWMNKYMDKKYGKIPEK